MQMQLNLACPSSCFLKSGDSGDSDMAHGTSDLPLLLKYRDLLQEWAISKFEMLAGTGIGFVFPVGYGGGCESREGQIPRAPRSPRAPGAHEFQD